MRFTPTPFEGAYVVEIEPIADERGFFARSFCREEFAAHRLDPVVDQCNISWNERAGTLRGMHLQAEPHAEAKLVRCTRGAIYDVIVDLRPESSTLHRWFGMELTDVDRTMLYAPKGFAHGFQTLADGCEVFYQMSAPYVPHAATGVRWDDPLLGIEWPVSDPIVSDRDRSFPLLDG